MCVVLLIIVDSLHSSKLRKCLPQLPLVFLFQLVESLLVYFVEFPTATVGGILGHSLFTVAICHRTSVMAITAAAHEGVVMFSDVTPHTICGYVGTA